MTTDPTDRRRAAFDLFERLPLPSPKDEAWRYVEIDFDLDDHVLVIEPGPGMADDGILGSVEDAIGRVTIVDGFTRSIDHSSVLDVVSISEAGRQVDLASTDLDKFSAANAAFGLDGVSITVPRGAVVDQPLVVDLQHVTGGGISFPVVTIVAGEQSEAAVVIVARSPDGIDAAMAPSLSVVAGDGSRLRVGMVQLMGDRSLSILHHRATVGRDATLRLGDVALGGRYGRSDLGVELDGNGGSVELVGLSFGEREQVIDYRIRIAHVGHDTSSDVHIKGAVEDNAQSVFTGLLRIEPDALRSSAFETNRNLVLSPGAKANSVPNLEILCDDVMCGHGSSVGPLEDDHLYYLQSRGLSRERAERVLIRGFFSEVLDRFPVPELVGPIGEIVHRRFVQAQTEGRLS